MQTSRYAIVVSPAASVGKRFQTSASNWGEFKEDLQAQGIKWDSMDAIVNPGRHTLTQNDATLPEGDFKLFLVATKNKAGNTPTSLAEEQLCQTLIRSIRKAAAKATENDMVRLTGQLIETVEGFYDVNLEEDDTATIQEAMQEARAL